VVSIARSEYSCGLPRAPVLAGYHAASASSVNQIVISPRWRNALLYTLPRQRGERLDRSFVSQFVTDFDKFLLIEVINRRANASDACVVSAILNARRRSCRALVRSGSTSRSSDIYCAPRSIANNSPHGIASLRSPEIRPLSEQMLFSPLIRLERFNVTAPSRASGHGISKQSRHAVEKSASSTTSCFRK
jgi:hypothetical protein